MIAVCAKAYVLLGCGYMMCFHALNAAARAMVAKGTMHSKTEPQAVVLLI